MLTPRSSRFLQFARHYYRSFQDHRTHVPAYKRAWLICIAIPISLLFTCHFILRRRLPLSMVAESLYGFELALEQTDIIAAMVYLFGVWEPDLSRYFVERLQPGDSVLDLGANIGYFTFLAASEVGPTGTVIAVEASPTIHAMLRRNIARNPALARSIQTVNKAVVAESGPVHIYRGPDGMTGLTTTLKSRAFELETEVEGSTLDELISAPARQRLRLVKIDVEGAEYTILPSLRTFLESCPASTEFIIELTPLFWPKPKPSIEEVIRPFLELGYTPYQIQNDYSPWRYLWPFTTTPPTPLTSPINPGWKGQLDVLLTKSRPSSDERTLGVENKLEGAT